MSELFRSVLIVVVIACVTVLGDYCLKRASLQEHFHRSTWFWYGCGLYAATAAGWATVMRHMKLATIGVLFAAFSLLFIAALGVVVFDERLSWREAAGIVLAIAAVVLLGRFAQ